MRERFDPNRLDRVDEIRVDIANILLESEPNEDEELFRLFNELDVTIFGKEMWWPDLPEEIDKHYTTVSQETWDKANKILDRFESRLILLRLSE
jgi:hypothetical protein